MCIRDSPGGGRHVSHQRRSSGLGDQDAQPDLLQGGLNRRGAPGTGQPIEDIFRRGESQVPSCLSLYCLHVVSDAALILQVIVGLEVELYELQGVALWPVGTNDAQSGPTALARDCSARHVLDLVEVTAIGPVVTHDDVAVII